MVQHINCAWRSSRTVPSALKAIEAPLSATKVCCKAIDAFATSVSLKPYMHTDKKDIVMELANLFMPSPVSGSGHHSPCSQTSKTIRYAEKYKLVFSLFNEDISKGGITQWNISAALDREFNSTIRALQCSDFRTARRSHLSPASNAQRPA